MSGSLPPTDVKTGKIGAEGDFPSTVTQRIVLGVIAIVLLAVLIHFGLR